MQCWDIDWAKYCQYAEWPALFFNQLMKNPDQTMNTKTTENQQAQGSHINFGTFTL